ncbi:MAG TPA: hypothetical protein VEY50_05475 [Lysobacter sp.]|nr:hypothetical protein [Lysobacter sp.]
MPTARRALAFVLLLLAAFASGCASAAGSRNDKLNAAQYAWSAAIRWGDFEGAWNLVDPRHRDAHPLTALELERYKQVQISAYRELGSQRPDKETALREIEIGVINRHTLAERTVRYRERWRWDREAKAWWIEDGLPDLWGEP